MTPAWLVKPVWRGRTAVIIGSGPSLTYDDLMFVRGGTHPAIVLKDTYRLAPWAEILYGCDGAWWEYVKGAPMFLGQHRVMLRGEDSEPAARRYGIKVLENTGEHGLELQPDGLRNGSNSGYQALGLAFHLGVRRILLTGFDMQPGEDGQHHWFGAHHHGLLPPFRLFREAFATIVQPLHAAGVEVVNCSRASALQCFRRGDLRQEWAK